MPSARYSRRRENHITIIVANDNGYGVIRHIQDKAAGGRRRFDTLLEPDLAALLPEVGAGPDEHLAALGRADLELLGVGAPHHAPQRSAAVL